MAVVVALAECSVACEEGPLGEMTKWRNEIRLAAGALCILRRIGVNAGTQIRRPGVAWVTLQCRRNG